MDVLPVPVLVAVGRGVEVLVIVTTVTDAEEVVVNGSTPRPTDWQNPLNHVCSRSRSDSIVHSPAHMASGVL